MKCPGPHLPHTTVQYIHWYLTDRRRAGQVLDRQQQNNVAEEPEELEGPEEQFAVTDEREEAATNVDPDPDTIDILEETQII